MSADGAAALAFGLERLGLPSPASSWGPLEQSQVVLLSQEPEPEQTTAPLLVAARGEDCARLLCIAHAAGQRFGCEIQFCISPEVLSTSLRIELEHIPLPPEFILRGGESVDDVIRSDHPALSFHRLTHGVGRGPRNAAASLIVSHGSQSEQVGSIVHSARARGSNLRHLSLQTLNPFPLGALRAGMDGVDSLIALQQTSPWIPDGLAPTVVNIEKLASTLKN